MNALPRSLLLGVLLSAGTVVSGPIAAGAQSAPGTATFDTLPPGTRNHLQRWVVPDDVCEVSYEAVGAGGGSGTSMGAGSPPPATRPGGAGALVTGDLAVVPGDVVHVVVGSAGQDGTEGAGNASNGYRALGGPGGSGGDSGAGSTSGTSGGGGGASDIRIGGTNDDQRVVVAGGGGGGGLETGTLVGVGGDGGLLGGDGIGSDPSLGPDGGGKGGTASAGGAGGVTTSGLQGAPGVLGAGGDGDWRDGGGGGGGLYGGGGGAIGGGGGGSSLVPSSSSVGTGTVADGGGAPTDGDGEVTFTWLTGGDCITDVPMTSTGGPLALAAAGAAGAAILVWRTRRHGRPAPSGTR